MKNNIRIVRNERDPMVPTPPEFNTLMASVKKTGWKSWKFKTGLALTIVGLIISTALLLRNQPVKTTGNAQQKADSPSMTVKPPLPALDVPYDTFEINVVAGDTITYKGCTNIIFKPGSIQESDGQRVEKTKVLYREFQNQTEIMMSGIPMMYDTAGKKYLFESGGMFELKSLNKNEKIAGARMVEVKMCTQHNQQNFNWYKLDEKSGNWNYIKPVSPRALNPTQTDTANHQTNENDGYAPIEMEIYQRKVDKAKPEVAVPAAVPAMMPPKRKDNGNPTFSIDANYIPELQVYTNVDFEVLPGQGYDANKLPDEWDYIKVEKTNTYGIYLVSLFNGNSKYSYRARPVFDNEQDYQTALKAFKKKEAEQQERLEKERKRQIALEKELIRKNEIARKRAEAWAAKAAEQAKTAKQKSPDQSFNYGTVTVALTIDQFGYYNSDRPISDNGSTVKLTYSLPGHARGQGQIYQYYLDRNAVMVNYAAAEHQFNLNYRTGEKYLLMAFAELKGKTRVAIISPDDFEKYIAGEKEVNVEMKFLDKAFENTTDLHAWIKQTFIAAGGS